DELPSTHRAQAGVPPSPRRDRRAGLSARPAVFLDRAGFLELRSVAVRDLFVIQEKIDEEDLPQVGTPEIQAGAPHADLVEHLQTVAPSKVVGALAISGKLVGKEVVDDDRFAPAVE